MREQNTFKAPLSLHRGGGALRLASLIVLAWLGLAFSDANSREGTMFVEGKWSEATQMAFQAKKPLLVFVGAEYCSTSGRLAQVFGTKEVGKFMNARFVCKRLNTENPLHNLRASNWGVTSIPTLLYMDRNNKIIHRVYGFRNSTQLMEESLAALKKMQPAGK